MLIKMGYMLIFFWRGGFCPPFVHVDRGDWGGGVYKMSTLVHSRGEGVKNGQNLVHVVVECPLTNMLVNLPTNRLQIEFLIEAHIFANILLNLRTHHWGNRILDTCS
jgi:hypothetical protein